MKKPSARRTSPVLILFSALMMIATSIFPLFGAASTQRARREHLTPEEIDQVRDNQELDKRIGVFAKAAERRVQAILNPQPATSKQAQKDAEKFGQLPESTRAQLLSDIARILDEAITNIDDAALHNEKSPLVPKAVRKLADAARSLLNQLTPLRDSAKEDEREALERAIEHAQSVIEAAAKLPSEAKK